MNIHLLSDLHLENSFHTTKPYNPDAPKQYQIPEGTDVVALAGDITSNTMLHALIHYWGSCPVPVLYVPGNHEFWGSSISEVSRSIISACKGTSIIPLLPGTHVIDDTVFIGATLWTPLNDPWAKMMAPNWSDFRNIKRFTFDYAQMLHMAHKDWIFKALINPDWKDKKKVVISHYLPFSKSINPYFQGNISNVFYNAECEDLVLQVEDQIPVLWVHGHTHSSYDYELDTPWGGLRVVCNPQGNIDYRNPDFIKDLIITV